MKMCGIKSIKTLALFLSLVGPVAASSWASTGPGGGRKPQEPPPQAFEACLDKSEGAKVELVSPRGDTMSAVCKALGDRLVAVPEGGGGTEENVAPPQGEPGQGNPPQGSQ
jgi:hypothetical protein